MQASLIEKPGKQAMTDWLRSKCRDIIENVRSFARERVGPHEGAALHSTMQVLKAAKLIDFVYMKSKIYTSDMARSLQKSFPFVGKVTEGLLLERDCYRIIANDTDRDFNLIAFWNDNRTQLPTWYRVAVDVVL